MKQGLERYLDGEGEDMVASSHDEQERVPKRTRTVKAMFIGTRRTDPHGGELKLNW